MIVTGGGLEAWVKRENDLHMIHMITEATIFLAALVGKEVFRRWAARRLQGY